MATYRTAAQEWSEEYNRLHAVPGKRGPVRLSQQGASILKMLQPYSWEEGGLDWSRRHGTEPYVSIRGTTVSWQPDYDSRMVQWRGGASGFPRGDGDRIMAAFRRLGGRSRMRLPDRNREVVRSSKPKKPDLSWLEKYRTPKVDYSHPSYTEGGSPRRRAPHPRGRGARLDTTLRSEAARRRRQAKHQPRRTDGRFR